MKDGEIVQVGTPDDVYFRSADMFVAGFIGTPPTNFFDVEIRTSGENTELVNPEFRIKLNPEESAGLTGSTLSSAVLGVRPEDIRIVPENKSDIKAEVMVVEPQGSFQITAVNINNKVVKLVVPSENKIVPGEKLNLAFNRERLHFFNPDTTKRI